MKDTGFILIVAFSDLTFLTMLGTMSLEQSLLSGHACSTLLRFFYFIEVCMAVFPMFALDRLYEQQTEI
jgi:hypothetical protein